jgi:hypothetical protein
MDIPVLQSLGKFSFCKQQQYLEETATFRRKIHSQLIYEHNARIK